MSSPIRAEGATAMKRISLLTLALGLTAFGAGGVATPAPAQDAPPGDAANGKGVYPADGCVPCHGRAGQGGAYNGPAPILAKTAMPFEGFKMQLRNPSNDMPAY